ncbi:diguanylate cyclase [Ectopseudomonas alcaliphila]|uniref:diguanylate cyclase n=1 Tax=Ectopseudomonas alcaliphila TaxID=101564 RepID=UPI0027800693|nr:MULTISPECIES: diguanylate cyclase [Pseudomonas]MDP9942359.1 diguanylate cyclase (GGDEF)-like protein [Pseudomonas sp. 3400]MDR7014263.1 diguanylate cyclase (GGDEF)-like protein [Pseudomonas alcaliphila]
MDKHDGNAIPQTLQEHLQQLGQQFAERLRQELPQLAQQGEQLRGVGDEQRGPLLQTLRDQLHRLAGTAGTFGFDQLGQQARELEQQAERWLERQQRQQQDLDEFVAALKQLGNQTASAESGAVQPQQVQQVVRGETATRLIYILEDEMAVGENMRLTLNNFGYQAEHFNAIAALDAALERQIPDALIVDVNLANEDCSGLDYAARLQQRLKTPLPLLVLTNQDSFATQLQAVRAGAQGFFAKPVDIPLLESRLERCFAQQQGEPYRVLIVDDDQDLASRYSLVLRGAGMLVEILQDPAQIFDHLRDFNPEVVLLDVNMPHCTGPELAQIIRCNDDWLRIPIIYLSAETDIAKQMSALIKAGDDFVTKPISDNALVAAVFSRAQRARLLSDALARDSLTGLLKHGDIKEQVAIELERALRSGDRASVVMLDIDHFKRVNDEHGHAAGDNVIRALANLLRQRLRRVDSLGRYGGEEFLAVLPDCTPQQAKQIVDEIRERFAELRFIADGGEFSCTLSAGIAGTDVHSQAEQLRERADKALYAAKHGGRNQVQVAASEEHRG